VRILYSIYVALTVVGLEILLRARPGAGLMWIMVVYLLIVAVGELIAISIGLILDRIYAVASLPVSLSLFFIVLWVGWALAVRWTEPKEGKVPKKR
jgi:hypothetical protein